MPSYNYAKGLAYFLNAKPVTLFASAFYLISYTIRPEIKEVHYEDRDSFLSDDDGAPIAIFSHGLGGSRFIYSTFISKFAEIGWTVYAVEHTDGTACTAVGPQGEIIHYQPIGKDENSWKDLRKSQLEFRTQEILKILDKVGRTNRDIYLIGHSFGAATMFNVLLKDKIRDFNIKHVCLVDPWWYCFENESLQNLKIKKKVFVKTAITENFHWESQDLANENIKRANVDFWEEKHCPETSHQDLSDFAVHVPRLLKIAGQTGLNGGIKHISDVFEWFVI
ncbi:hypothetical protein ROZALSC1DRAFT_31729 [Rozella allomycis CSF55]|uniref:1-alkyl-2-acetylglycerophosphocholine esterase n=1 Tax=Rozella allomycis (strain CSF55) TaxID=988480 RepID=A0A4P9YAW9_ROZAC|nr:hypothetical protein ROZALSC1DRAFT_31729 [Rozella allomycis CSF55]